jgi:hypothetical protein
MPDLPYIEHKERVIHRRPESPQLAGAVTGVTLAIMFECSLLWMPSAVGRAPRTSRGSSGNYFQVWTMQMNYYFFSTKISKKCPFHNVAVF